MAFNYPLLKRVKPPRARSQGGPPSLQVAIAETTQRVLATVRNFRSSKWSDQLVFGGLSPIHSDSSGCTDQLSLLEAVSSFKQPHTETRQPKKRDLSNFIEVSIKYGVSRLPVCSSLATLSPHKCPNGRKSTRPIRQRISPGWPRGEPLAKRKLPAN